MKKKFFYNGTILTMNPHYPTAKNLIAGDGLIEQIDVTEDTLEQMYSSANMEYIDLQGSIVLPGFHDSHMHLVEYGYNQKCCVDLSEATSAEDVVRRMRSFIEERQIPEGGWVIGSRWDQEKFSDKRLLSRIDMDQVSKRHYVFAKRVCIHVAAVNSKVLELCGIHQNTYQNNKYIGRYSDGMPDGRIYEDGISNIVLAKKEAPSETEIEHIIEDTLQEIKRRGFTAVQSDDMKAFSDFTSKERILHAYNHLRNQGRLPIRVFEQIQVSSLEEFYRIREILKSIPEDPWFSWSRLKLILDGSLGAESAAVSSPYKESKNQGFLNFSDKELDALVKESYESHMQIMCHCIGDRAMEQAIRIITPYQRQYGKEQRPRLVHCQIGTRKLLRYMAQEGFLADIQPAFVPSDYEIVEKKLHIQKEQVTYGWRTMIEREIPVSGGSDSPVECYDALYGIQTAVTRSNLEGIPERGWLPEERLTPQQALALYTKGSAYAVKMEKKLGCIAPGYFSDFVILKENPLLVPADQIHNISILETHCGI